MSILVVLSAPALAQATPDCVARWSDIVWPGGTDPTGSYLVTNTCVHVPEGLCVLYDAAGTHWFDTLLLDGSLEIEDGAERELALSRLLVERTGSLEIGYETDRHESELDLIVSGESGSPCTSIYELAEDSVDPTIYVATLVPVDPTLEVRLHRGRAATLGVRGSATLDVHGSQRDATWRHVFGSALVGGSSTVVTVEGPLDWVAGDRVVITSSDYDPEHAEEAEIGSVVPRSPPSNLVDITLTAPVVNDHFTGKVGGTSAAGAPDVFLRPQIGLLSQNVTISGSWDQQSQGDCSDLTWNGATGAVVDVREACSGSEDGASGDDCDDGLDGADADTLVDCADPECASAGVPTVRLEHATLTQMGEPLILGRYPVHIHELGDESPDSYVRGLSIHDSANRGIVVHGTELLEISENVVHNVNGHAFYLEPSTQGHRTRNNVLIRNLASLVLPCLLMAEELDGDVPLSSGFWFEDASNQFVDNVAAGGPYAGFYYSEDDAGPDLGDLCGDEPWDYVTETEQPDVHVNAAYTPYEPSTAYATYGDCEGSFRGNWSHSSRYGFWADEHKNKLIRLFDFRAFKHTARAIELKNHGITEVISFRASDNRTAIWPASHAYHLAYEPEFYVENAHVVGVSPGGEPPPGVGRMAGLQPERVNAITSGDTVQVVSSYDNFEQSVTVYGVSLADVAQSETLELEGTTPVAGALTWGKVMGFTLSDETVLGTITLSDSAGTTLFTASPGDRTAGTVLFHGGAAVMDSAVSVVADGATTARVLLAGTDTDRNERVEAITLAGTTPVASTIDWAVLDAVALGYLPSTRKIELIGLDAVLGVEVYEGRLKVADSTFEFFPMAGSPTEFAAFGTHKDFPFYSNDPDNAVEALEIDLTVDQGVYFKDPQWGSSGETMVMLKDLDGDLDPGGGGAEAWIVANDDFAEPLGSGVYYPEYNATVVPTTAEAYGQLVVEWCSYVTDDTPPLTGRCLANGGPSRVWDVVLVGAGTYDRAYRMDVRDATDCPSPCTTDTQEAFHSNEGTHNVLAANVIAAHDYAVTFYENEAGTNPYTAAEMWPPLSLLPDIRAMMIHLRSAPDLTSVLVTVPVPDAPTAVERYEQPTQVFDQALVAVAGVPVDVTQYQVTTSGADTFVTLFLQVIGDDTSVLLEFTP